MSHCNSEKSTLCTPCEFPAKLNDGTLHDALMPELAAPDDQKHSATNTAIDLTLPDAEESAAAGIASQMASCLARVGAAENLSRTHFRDCDVARRISNLVIWIEANLDKDLSVTKLAERVDMGCRNFTRRYVTYVGTSPARHVLELRMEAARRNLSESTLSLGEIARAHGFAKRETFRRLFTKTFKISPREFRLRNCGGSSESEL